MIDLGISTVTVMVVWTHLATTLYLTGLIWVVQVVHYPLMGRVPPESFTDFHRRHTRRIGIVVIPPMLIELVTACVLVAYPVAKVPAALPWIGLALLAVVWLSTFALQVPQHRMLARGFDLSAHRRLVRSNWLRTAAWTVRAGIAVGIAMIASR